MRFWWLTAERFLLTVSHHKVLVARADYEVQLAVETAGLWWSVLGKWWLSDLDQAGGKHMAGNSCRLDCAIAYGTHSLVGWRLCGQLFLTSKCRLHS